MTPHQHSVFAILVGLIIMIGVVIILAHGNLI
jgi:hypothetical protein